MEAGQSSTILSRLKCFGCQGYGHMKLECPTYLKFISKSKSLTASLIDTELNNDPDSD